MKVPSILVSGLLVAAVAILQYFLGNIGDFGLPDLYAPIIVAALSAILRAVQEYQATQAAMVRDLQNGAPSGTKRRGYMARVLWAD